jgi:hypothetical protein
MTERIRLQRKKKPILPIITNPLLTSPERSTDLASSTDAASSNHDLSRISPRYQAKLQIGEPGDTHEQEADKFALQVMSTSDSALQQQTTSRPAHELIQAKYSVQRLADRDSAASGEIENKLHSRQGGGSPLSDDVQNFMEPRIGADFSHVKVHTDGEAVQMAENLGAQAFTYGSDVYFGAGKSPGNNELTAHELTHVVQQTGAVQRQSAKPKTDLPTSDVNAPWQETENLKGNPPVRDRLNPPNKNIVEDEAVYQQRLEAARAALERQRQRVAPGGLLLDKNGTIIDYRYWFAKVYGFVTENEINFVESKAYYYPSYVLASVLYFEKIYEDNFNAFNEGAKVEDHWRTAFEEAAKQKKLTDMYFEMMQDPNGGDSGMAIAALSQLVLGAANSLVSSMQAHIRYDLPRAEAWVFNTYYSQFPNAKLKDFQPDFMSMSGVFDNAARSMNEDMASKLGVPVDLVPQLMQDTAMRKLFDADMATERADTWHRAEELVDNNLAGNDPYQLQNGQLQGNVTSSDHQSGLQNLPTQGLRPTMTDSAPSQSDTEIRESLASMSDSDIAKLPTTQKVQMIRRLLKGWTGGEDEATILRMLNASKTSGELTVIIDGADAWDMMYAIDGENSKKLREFFRENYYSKTAQQTALRLIRKCLDGETAEWEEEMVADLLEKRDDRRSIVEEIGNIYGGPLKQGDKNFKNGLYKLEWQLDGAEEATITQLFGSSGLSWASF